jgi:hypothetical protein
LVYIIHGKCACVTSLLSYILSFLTALRYTTVMYASQILLAALSISGTIARSAAHLQRYPTDAGYKECSDVCFQAGHASSNGNRFDKMDAFLACTHEPKGIVMTLSGNINVLRSYRSLQDELSV